MITNDAHTLEPATASVTNGSQASSLPNFARNRKRKRIYVKTAFDRGRKLYQMKDKVRIKKVQSLRVGGASFLGSGDRPTMATNAFQVCITFWFGIPLLVVPLKRKPDMAELFRVYGRDCPAWKDMTSEA